MLFVVIMMIMVAVMVMMMMMIIIIIIIIIIRMITIAIIIIVIGTIAVLIVVVIAPLQCLCRVLSQDTIRKLSELDTFVTGRPKASVKIVDCGAVGIASKYEIALKDVMSNDDIIS